MKNIKRYLISGIVGFSLIAGSIVYHYSLDAMKGPKESAAIVENYPVPDEQADVISLPISTGLTDKPETVVPEVSSTKSPSKPKAVNTLPSADNLGESAPVPDRVQPTVTPSIADSQTKEAENSTTIPTVIPSAVVSQPTPPKSTPVKTTVKTPVKTTKKTTKKTSTTKAS